MNIANFQIFFKSLRFISDASIKIIAISDFFQKTSPPKPPSKTSLSIPVLGAYKHLFFQTIYSDSLPQSRSQNSK